ncbi:MAG: hypothetical protein IJF13_07290 [Clostridia bacterium]|nr:hypothetical protein [Clostridia bacterium]
MKKRIICLLLGMLMVASSLLMAGCNNGDTGFDDEEERLATTLHLMIPTGESTTAEAVSAVQDALNSIFGSKYKTRIVIDAVSEDEYLEKLTERFDAQEKAAKEAEEAKESRKKAEKEAKKRGETLPPLETEPEVTGDVTVMNELGFTETVYPELEEHQIDIFFLSGIDNLWDFYEDERLAYLDDDLGSSSKKLADFIHPTFIEAAKLGGSSVAVLNNHTIGEYTMLLINKELADKYYYDTTGYKTLADAVEFIEDMAVSEPEYTPFLEEVDTPNFIRWSDDESFYGADVNSSNVFGKATSPITMFQSNSFQSYYSIMRLFEEKGYFSEDPENDDKFAAAVVKGSLEDKLAYEEKYYVTVLQVPVALNDDIYAGMFCVNGHNTNKEVSRSMEIITLLNTDSTVRNLLQYGVEGLHYKLNANGEVVRLNDDYSMNILHTGNSFVAYPEEGMSKDAWVYGKQQNLDSTTYSILGYSFSEKDAALFAPNATLYDEIWETLENATYDQLTKTTGEDNPYNIVTDILRFQDRQGNVSVYNSVTNAGDESHFAARLNEWYNSNF